jgi:hypothetical protein
MSGTIRICTARNGDRTYRPCSIFFERRSQEEEDIQGTAGGLGVEREEKPVEGILLTERWDERIKDTSMKASRVAIGTFEPLNSDPYRSSTCLIITLALVHCHYCPIRFPKQILLLYKIRQSFHLRRYGSEFNGSNVPIATLLAFMLVSLQ